MGTVSTYVTYTHFLQNEVMERGGRGTTYGMLKYQEGHQRLTGTMALLEGHWQTTRVTVGLNEVIVSADDWGWCNKHGRFGVPDGKGRLCQRALMVMSLYWNCL